MLSLLEIAAVLLTLSALFGWLNHKLLQLPHSIGLLVISVASSFVLIGVDLLFPHQHLYDVLTQTLKQIDFAALVMNGMLAFLLFAGALQVDYGRLRARWFPVLVLAGVGTVLSTGLVGVGLYAFAAMIGQHIPLIWALVFGAIISPTDPVAVISTLKNVRVPPNLEAEMQGESLFNDGVGVVLFTLMVLFARGGSPEETSASAISKLLIAEAGGGLLLGLVTGYVAYWAMRLIDDYAIEVLISLALVTATYALAQRLHLSGPLSMVSAGLLIGERGPGDAMSERTQTYVFGLWTLIDEVLNSVLFLLIGLEVLVVQASTATVALAAAAPVIVLVSRILSISVPLLLVPWSRTMSASRLPFLTWAGIRGGISVALALSIPETESKGLILTATYAVVLFSVIVQGSTLKWVAERTLPQGGDLSDETGA
ncbi:MAG: sodium/hydrogen exchanger [Hyphomicrobiales bacterium]|nr:sodium/hydrogen exchanger [Hyphomicrobiales bacterium]